MLTTKQVHALVDRAYFHNVKHSGILPDDDPIETRESIAAVANQSFNAKATVNAFDKSLAKLDHTTREAISEAAWTMLSAYQDAAFAFGAAVGLQLGAGSRGHTKKSKKSKK